MSIFYYYDAGPPDQNQHNTSQKLPLKRALKNNFENIPKCPLYVVTMNRFFD